ncbi:Hsp20/alpha crystallin family protein [Phytoactinopolyspora halotolerans]|uniref:Hsp20/alpha crystallin family protein n=1 Tax=Phytoactinopolyspora halotolerans TaxID=1981512 RepID=A0A6L9SCN2_9ACTN|nr:Hsp20/alpha crystallin family protein [Phytoactinopolyspora halotolerans]NEE02454.1 Hsp20/alpha crystallin family protein [Phytoactinopolyspora halotolerans]
MVTRFDPFREMDRLAEHLLGAARNAATMPMDLYRTEDHYVLHFDLPGIDPGSIDVSVENSTLTVRAERTGRSRENVQWLARERAVGTYARQLNLGDGLSLDKIDATYADGVLTLTIPVAEQAKPRRIEVTRADVGQAVETHSSSAQEIQS